MRLKQIQHCSAATQINIYKKPMELILYHTVAFYVIIFCVEDCLTYKHKVVSKPEAGQECSQRGGSLLNYEEIQNKTSASKYLDQLENGDTAWIGGYAEFSQILDWQGCYSITDVRILNTFEMEDRNLFLCSKECLRHGYYVGVKNTTCYCVESYFYSLSAFIDTVNPSLCYISCSNNGIDSCGGDLHMDLYEIRRYIIWGTNEPADRQCVYYKLSSYAFKTYEAYTASCHTFHIGSLVCQEVKGSVLLTATCTNISTYWNTEVCFKAEPSTRQEAHKRCIDINGQLIDYKILPEFVELMNHTSMFWTRLFRSFSLSNNHTSNAVCVAATKVNNIIYFEPDDCFMKKYFLCKYKELNASTSVTQQQTRLTTGWVRSQALGTTESKQNSSSQATGTTESKQNSSSQATGKTTSKQDSSIYEDPIFGYIFLAVSVVALAVAAVVMILLYKFKMWIMGAVLPRVKSGHRGEGFCPQPKQRNDENYSLVSSSRQYAVPGGENRSPNTQSRQSGSQIPIAESSLMKEDLRTVELHHVYEGLSGDRQHAAYETISQ